MPNSDHAILRTDTVRVYHRMEDWLTVHMTDDAALDLSPKAKEPGYVLSLGDPEAAAPVQIYLKPAQVRRLAQLVSTLQEAAQ